MRNSKYLFSLLLVFSFFLFGFFKEEINERFISKEGKFSVNFPGKPVSQVKKLDSGLTLNLYTLDNENQGFLVTYTDYEEKDFENKDPLEILENAKNGVGSKGVFIENYPVFYGDYHGIKYVMESTDGPKKYTFFGEIYLIKRRLYQIMFISENGEKNSTEVNDFFNSFEIDLDNEKSKIALLLEEMNFNYAIDSDSDYRLDINFEDGRSQVVYLNYWDNEFESDRQLLIWSPVAKFKSELPDTMMKNLMIYNGNHQSCNFQFISANGDSLMLRIIGFTSLNNNSDLIRKMIIHLSSSADDVEKHYFNSNKW